ncbi:MAG: phosphoglycerate kinase [Deltaproteobacteria bacterium]|nr:phosphoglycerate kinase [Deltaproteobacteria bacterium]
MKTIKDIAIAGKRLLIRVDFNVPLDKQQRITDDSRIQAVLPTLKYALGQKARIIVASHLGRPKGKIAPEFSLKPAAERLSVLLDQPVQLAADCVGESVETMVAAMKPGDIVVLENLRFHPDEEKNADAFAKSLAGLCDVYVNDAFAVSHRANASVEAITRFAPLSVAGFLLKNEIDYFNKAMTTPLRPLVAVIGGAKVSSKLAALENMLLHVDKILIGGAMANTFLRAMGHATGKSLVETELIETAGTILKKASEKGVKIYLPVDGVTAAQVEPTAAWAVFPVQEIPDDQMILDIGPASSLLYAEALQGAKTIVWNGPMGVFEMAPFSKGTFDMVNHVTSSGAITIVGGGDTDAAIHRSGKADQITYISTGGGAFLELLEGKILPGVAALESISRDNS